jgi:hypothetical protein
MDLANPAHTSTHTICVTHSTGTHDHMQPLYIYNDIWLWPTLLIQVHTYSTSTHDHMQMLLLASKQWPPLPRVQDKAHLHSHNHAYIRIHTAAAAAAAGTGAMATTPKGSSKSSGANAGGKGGRPTSASSGVRNLWWCTAVLYLQLSTQILVDMLSWCVCMCVSVPSISVQSCVFEGAMCTRA